MINKQYSSPEIIFRIVCAALSLTVSFPPQAVSLIGNQAHSFPHSSLSPRLSITTSSLLSQFAAHRLPINSYKKLVSVFELNTTEKASLRHFKKQLRPFLEDIVLLEDEVSSIIRIVERNLIKLPQATNYTENVLLLAGLKSLDDKLAKGIAQAWIAAEKFGLDYLHTVILESIWITFVFTLNELPQPERAKILADSALLQKFIAKLPSKFMTRFKKLVSIFNLNEAEQTAILAYREDFLPFFTNAQGLRYAVFSRMEKIWVDIPKQERNNKNPAPPSSLWLFNSLHSFFSKISGRLDSFLSGLKLYAWDQILIDFARENLFVLETAMRKIPPDKHAAIMAHPRLLKEVIYLIRKVGPRQAVVEISKPPPNELFFVRTFTTLVNHSTSSNRFLFTYNLDRAELSSLLARSNKLTIDLITDDITWLAFMLLELGSTQFNESTLLPKSNAIANRMVLPNEPSLDRRDRVDNIIKYLSEQMDNNFDMINTIARFYQLNKLETERLATVWG